MRTVPSRLVGMVLLAVAATAAAGQEPTLEVQLVPERFGVQDVARLVITVTGGSVEGGPPRPDRLENLQIVGGPSTERQFSWVNGVASSSTRYIYFLQALDVGPASVGPITVEVDGHTLISSAVSAEVVEGSVAPPRRSRRLPANPFEELLGPRPRRAARVGLRLLVPRTRLWVGEPMPVTVVLDTTAAVEGFEWVKPPAFPGWWTQRVDLPEEVQGSVVEREGVRYRRYPVARYVLIPLKAGTLVVPPIQARIGLRSPGLFAPGNVVERATPEARFEIEEPPPPPPGFFGAVGDLRYTATLEPRRVELGGSVTLTLTLEGDGNLPLVEAPTTWPTCRGCDIYPPEEESRVTVDAGGIHGRRSWAVAVVPRQAGTLALEPVTLAVFDPSRKQYRETTLGPFQLVVLGPTPTPEPTVPPESRAREAPAVSREAGTPAGPRWPVWSLVLAALAAGLGLGLALALAVLRSRRGKLPPPRPGQTAADRARELQGALERWWLGLPERRRTGELERHVEELRRELEAVRFAPGRADHSETVADLEHRLRNLLRRGR